MWQADLSIVIKTYSKYHIDVLIMETDGRLWRFTGFYGERSTERIVASVVIFA
jgi:hypothetical protein